MQDQSPGLVEHFIGHEEWARAAGASLHHNL